MPPHAALPPVLDLAPMAPPVIVVGDVHLTAEEPGVVRRFDTFLDTVPQTGGTLVLLGDLFDWWVGRAQGRVPFAQDVLGRLRALSDAGIRLTFLGGNRDYSFDGADGLEIELWPDVVRTKWGEKTVVLSHGDLLCSQDHSYLRMRAILRSRPVRFGQGLVPFPAAAYAAKGLRDLSDRSYRRNPGAQLGLDYGLARAWLEGYDADVLVVGHVHTGVHHRLGDEDGRVRDVYVLKDWQDTANAVVFDGRTVELREQ